MALPLRYLERTRTTEDEYLAFEASSLGRWEFVEDDIRQMAGGSEDHNTIALNIHYALRTALGFNGCRAFVADVKVRAGDGSHLCPNVFVVYGPRQHHQNRTDVITNPVLIVEVLSPSTAGYDRGEKFDHYATIPTLMDYLLVAQDEPRVWLFSRRGEQWSQQETAGLASAVYLPSLALSLTLAAIYALVDSEWADA